MSELQFMSIREVAKTGLISEHYLRLMVKRGDCPCIKSGKKVLVNYPALIEMLDRKSRGETDGRIHTSTSKDS